MNSNHFTRHLEVLTSTDPANPAWESTAAEHTAHLLKLASSPGLPAHFDTALLPIFAATLSKRPSSLLLRSSFVHAALLHLFHPVLHPLLIKSLCRHEIPNAQSTCYRVPDWWPSFPAQPALVSPFEYKFELPSFAETSGDQITSIIHVVLHARAIFDNLVSETEVSWKALRDLALTMGQSRAHVDLLCLLVLHDVDVIANLHRLSVQTSCQTAQKIAKLVIEQILSRRAIVCSLASVDGLQGAKRLLALYPSPQHSASDLAANDCFRFIVDYLNQTAGGTYVNTPTTVTFIHVSSYKLAHLCTLAPTTKLYEEFNKRSNVHSLLTICSQFGCDTAQCFLMNSGSSLNFASFLPAVKKFNGRSLPPLPKPNYFILDRKYPGSNDTLTASSGLEDISGLHFSIYYLLKSLQMTMQEELQKAIVAGQTDDIAQKILVTNVQHILSFILAAMICNQKVDRNSMICYYTELAIFDIAGKLFERANPVQTSLVWVTLFNFANDVCYVEISLKNTMSEFLEKITTAFQTEEQKTLIMSGVKDFVETFEESDTLAPAANYEDDTSNWKVLSKHEYMFLYTASTKTRKEPDETQKTNQSSRQQSVHIDRFGRD